jgi:hypothetical protein
LLQIHSGQKRFLDRAKEARGFGGEGFRREFEMVKVGRIQSESSHICFKIIAMVKYLFVEKGIHKYRDYSNDIVHHDLVSIGFLAFSKVR